MPSGSISSVPVIRANSASRATSALDRASRVISIPKIAPTSPEQTLVTSSVNPSRGTPHLPEIPRSVSITSMSLRAQPSAAALLASAYWLLVDSVCSRTWAIEDWRRYISAVRSRWLLVILCSPFTAASQHADGHVGQRRHRLGPRGPGQHGGAHRLPQLSAGQQLGIDRRDLRQHRLDLGPPAQVTAHHPGQRGRHVPGPATAGRARGEVGIRAVRLAVRAPAAGPPAPAPLPVQRMERMSDNHETRRVTGRRGTMPPPSARRAPALPRHAAWGSPPPSPRAGSSFPTTSGSRS